jgi:acetyl-CoA carboxylase beta subunit
MSEKIPTEKSKKKRKQEDEYFAREEAKKIAGHRERLDKERAEAEKKHLKELHWMRCPKCGHELEEKEIQKVMIDQCRNCGGIWLDAGELEVLTASSSSGFLKGLLKSVAKPRA